MKQLFTLFTVWSLSLIAQTGPQPLFISNITFLPKGCGEATTNIQVIASGGQPAADGSYTYSLQGQPSITKPTALFQNVPITLGIESTLDLLITDSANNTVSSQVTFTESQTESVSMSIDSLPLGTGQGCISLTVTKSAGQPDGLVSLFIESDEVSSDIQTNEVDNDQPFKLTFSALPSPSLKAVMELANDCKSGGSSFFSVTFPFPQGMGNALKVYIFNKYCSCVLQKGTIPVVPF